MVNKKLEKMPQLLKYTCISVGIALLATLVVWVYIACQPQDSSDKIFDEPIATDTGSTVRLVHPVAPEKGVIFFVSDSLTPAITTDYARKFAALSYYVVVLQATDLLQPAVAGKTQCLNVADYLLELQDGLRRQLNLDTGIQPILVGINEGAAAAYGAVAQDDTHRFHAAISINFSGQLHSHAEICAAERFTRPGADGVLELSPVEHLASRWYLFQDNTQTPSMDLRGFTDQIGNAKFTPQRKNGALVIPEVLQVLQWLDPRLVDQLSSDNAEGNLPLMEVTTTVDNPSHTLAIMLTGDGGWAEIDKGIAANLAAKGIPTVALDSLSYFWQKRTPREAAQDIENTMTDYLEKWQKKQVILIGYSFGADVLPFIVNRIHTENQKHIALIALLGVGKSAAFEFHLSSWMDVDKSADRLPLAPEIRKMAWAKSICLYGVADEDTDCAALGELGVKVIGMSGDHHFDEQYTALVQHILDNSNANQELPSLR